MNFICGILAWLSDLLSLPDFDLNDAMREISEELGEASIRFKPKDVIAALKSEEEE